MFKARTILISIGAFGALLIASYSFALPIGYASRGNDLFKIDLSDSSKTKIGPIGFDDVEGLSFNPVTGILYGIDDENSSNSFESLIAIDPLSGTGTRIGSLGFSASNPGFAISPSGIAYLSHDPGGATNDVIRRIDLMTGLTEELLGSTGVNGIDGLAFAGDTLYGVSGFSSGRGLYSIDLTSGAATLVLHNGDFGGQMGLASDGIDLYAISSDSNIFTISSLKTTPVVSESHIFRGAEFEGLAVLQPALIPIPEPGTLQLLILGLAGLVGCRWQQTKQVGHKMLNDTSKRS